MAKRNTRDIGLRTNGKGDADRSPGWRAKYDTINWPCGGRGAKKFHKVYGTKKPQPENQGPHIKVL